MSGRSHHRDILAMAAQARFVREQAAKRRAWICHAHEVNPDLTIKTLAERFGTSDDEIRRALTW